MQRYFSAIEDVRRFPWIEIEDKLTAFNTAGGWEGPNELLLTIGRRPRQLRAAWWWLGFLLLLGPIAIGRLDSVSVPIVILEPRWEASDRRADVPR